MLVKPFFHFNCGHSASNFVSGSDLNTKREKICPECLSGAIKLVTFTCELCGAPAETTASGYKCSQRLLCPECRKMYNRWDTMARKAKNSRRSFPDLQQYIETKKHSNDPDNVPEQNLEPPLTHQEIKDIASFGKRLSPCAKCSYIVRDKNEAPCNQCPKLSAFTQTKDKLFLDSLYI